MLVYHVLALLRGKSITWCFEAGFSAKHCSSRKKQALKIKAFTKGITQIGCEDLITDEITLTPPLSQNCLPPYA